MSAVLPTVQGEARSAATEDETAERVDEELSGPGCPGGSSSGDEEEYGTSPLLHSSGTLEYHGGLGEWRGAAGEEVDGLEMTILAAGEPSARTLPKDKDVAEKPSEASPSVGRRPFPLARPTSRRGRTPAGSRPPAGEGWPDSDEEAPRGPRTPPRCTRDNLKAAAALAGSVVVYPCFLYGAYVFLPFDVPLLPNLHARTVYTLRCSVFATVPILMGIVVYGLARLCSSSVDPFGQRKEEVEIHLRFVTDSIHLFVLFFINLVVLSTYLPQEVLKLLPLLTAFFALARLIYWLTFTISSTFRGFGYGLTFFPILGLLVCNLCYMFILAPDKMFATSVSVTQEEQASSSRQRFWG